MRSFVILLLLAAAARALDPSALRAAAEYSAGNRGTVLVVQERGKRVFAQAANGASLSTAGKIYSGTKLFWILAGLAAEEDGILGLDERVADTIGEWTDGSERSRVTIRQLLNFTSGIEPNFALHGDDIANRNTLAITTRFGSAPGGSFIYGPASLQVFHEVMKRKLAGQGTTPTAFLERRVLRPLGLGSQRYMADRAGNPLLATGFKMDAARWLRMGECILRQGSPVVGAHTFQNTTRGTRCNPAFGMALWNNRLAPGGREVDPEDMLELPWQRQHWSRACLSKHAPSDLLACIGSGGQRLYVVPSRELIVVRQGNFGHFHDAEFLEKLFAH
ncbi:MAG: serine hydrolase domain-containing protein [Chthoniobacteraceae bacterium]